MSRKSTLALALFTLSVVISPTDAQTLWQARPGLSMGKIEVFFSPADSVVLASAAGGIFRSTDCGRRWTPTSLGQLAWFLMADSAGRLHAGTSSQGVFRSTDAGINWAPLNAGLTSLEITGLAAVPNGNIVALTGSGVFGLGPHDTAWNLLNGTIWRYALVVLASNSRNQLFAGASAGPTWRSTDGGVTWEKVELVDPRGLTRTIFIDRKDRIFRSMYGRNLERSTDDGNTWSTVYADNVGWIDADSSGMLFGGTSSGVIRSSDGGATWALTPGPYSLAIAALDNGTVLASGLNGEIYRSRDHGTSFSSLSTSVGGTVTGLALGEHGLLFAGTFASGVFRSTDQGNSWTESDSGLVNPAVNDLLLAPKNRLLVATQHGVFVTTDNGESWAESDSGLAYKWTDDLCMAPSGQLFAGTEGGGLFVSNDTGATWRPSGAGVLPSVVRKVAFAPHGVLYVAGYPGGVYRSSDSGAHWEFVSSAFSQHEGVRAVTADSSGHVIAVSETAMKCSDDEGQHWRTVGYDFQVMLWNVFLDPAGHLYASTCFSKLYRSTDYGVTWTDYSSGLPDSPVFSFVVGDDGRMFLGGDGVYRSVQSVLSGVPQSEGLAEKFDLAQNYPNPFNPSTTIRYSLPYRSRVTLAVYNVLGQRVAELVDDNVDGGYHEVQFNAGRLASGVYFYRMQAGAYSQVHAMALVR